MVKTATICIAACLLATTVACSVATPLEPVPLPANTFTNAADGSNLKATAPKLIAPINNDTIPNQRPTFIIEPADGQFAKIAFFYEIELTTDSGEVVRIDTIDTTQFELPVALQFDSPYRWRSRAVLPPGIGPWSSQARFFTAKPPQLNRPTRNSPEEEWRKWFFELVVLRGEPNLSVRAMGVLRPDLVAVEADFQNGWRGDMRGRLFLPVPGCPWTATNGNAPGHSCAFARTVDLGDEGRPWRWIYRGQT